VSVKKKAKLLQEKHTERTFGGFAGYSLENSIVKG
jgi:hypothetical protein